MSALLSCFVIPITSRVHERELTEEVAEHAHRLVDDRIEQEDDAPDDDHTDDRADQSLDEGPRFVVVEHLEAAYHKKHCPCGYHGHKSVVEEPLRTAHEIAQRRRRAEQYGRGNERVCC